MAQKSYFVLIPLCSGLSMSIPSIPELTHLLVAWGNGDQGALDRLTPLVYDELHRLARRYMAAEHGGHILQTTALVNEAYLRLIHCEHVQWQNRAHFFGLAAQLMRRVLVDFARTQGSLKRGGEALRVSVAEANALVRERGLDLVALDEALQALARLSPRQSRVVELRFFGGLSLQETAEVLRVSVGTVRRDWSLAQAWLHRELSRWEQS